MRVTPFSGASRRIVRARDIALAVLVLCAVSALGAFAHAETYREVDAKAEGLDVMIEFRDNALLDSELGRAVNEYYYKYTLLAKSVIVKEHDSPEVLKWVIALSVQFILLLIKIWPAVAAFLFVLAVIVAAGVAQTLFRIRARNALAVSAAVFALLAAAGFMFHSGKPAEALQMASLRPALQSDVAWVKLDERTYRMQEAQAAVQGLAAEYIALIDAQLKEYKASGSNKFSGDFGPANDKLTGISGRCEAANAEALALMNGESAAFKGSLKGFLDTDIVKFAGHADPRVRFEYAKTAYIVIMSVKKAERRMVEIDSAISKACTNVRMRSSVDEFAQDGRLKACLAVLEGVEKTRKNNFALARGEIVAAAVALDIKFEAVLINMLDDADQRVKLWSALALGELGSIKAVPKLIHILEYDRDMHPRDKAVVALGKIGDPAAIGPVKAALADYRNMYITLSAGDALKELNRKNPPKKK